MSLPAEAAYATFVQGASQDGGVGFPFTVINLAPLVTGTASAVNSTTTPLAANAAFQGGAWDSVLSFSSIGILIATDVNSGPVLLQWSSDRINIDAQDQFAHTSLTGLVRNYDFPIRAGAQWFRLRYTNSTAPQTFFRLETCFRNAPTDVVFPHFLGINGIWQPQQGNTDQNLFAQGNYTATQQTQAQFNPNYRGASFALIVSAVPAAPGAGGLDLAIQGESADGTVTRLNMASTLIQAVGSYRWILYPGANATSISGNIIQVLSLPLPPIWRAQINVGDAQQYSYNLNVDLQQ